VFAQPAAHPFSHRLHLELKLECAFCHAAAPSSTKASDDLLPSKQVCLGCHETAVISRPPKARVDKFSHQLHLRMGNIAPILAKAIDHGNYLQPAGEIRAHLNTKNACEACHRGLEQSDRVTPAALPQMADCLVCHSQIEPPYSCETCHDQTAELKPASHNAPHFLDAHSSGRMQMDQSTCALCHGRTFQCMGCH
jgi:predicted CXXCH cytochrome family protein